MPGEVSAVAVAGVSVAVQPLQTVAESVVVPPGLTAFAPLTVSAAPAGSGATLTVTWAVVVLLAPVPRVIVNT